jgi:iron complex outermembrane recepter protein
MSELIVVPGRHLSRRQLLSTVSAITLIAAACAAGNADAANDDTDRPTVWIELGGQMDRATGQGASLIPGFVGANPDSPVLHPISPIEAQNPPPFGFGGEGKISFVPEQSDWIFSASVRYGRSGNNREVDHQTNGTYHRKYLSGVPAPSQQPGVREDFADTVTIHRESHSIVDFAAGKDVGLGMFVREATSTLNLGVRFAQFSSSSSTHMRARPDLHFKYFPSATAPSRLKLPLFHTYFVSGHSSRSFEGGGPSLSWNGSAPFMGNLQKGEVALDWGANAALLFGKQKTRVQHHESGHYYHSVSSYNTAVYSDGGGHSSDRSVVVPNVGGFAGASYRIENFKVSLGYRADFFFGAIDGGIDTRKSETLGFYGPFASVSVGLGG